MKPARIIALAIALVAAAAASFLIIGRSPKAPEPAQIASPSSTEDVLVAGYEITMGSTVKEGDLRWQAWEKDLIPSTAIRRSVRPAAASEYSGMMTRTALIKGQLISTEYLTAAGGFIASILPSGKVAVAVAIDNRGGASAGNLIFPNDHVDVIRTFTANTELNASGDSSIYAEVIIRNVRVLAIGDNLERTEGAKTSSGTTATLEVSSKQAELIMAAQRNGRLILALRAQRDNDAVAFDQKQLLTVVRYGASKTSLK